MPSDEDYQQTKQRKRRGTPLESPFKELADWISAKYHVHVLNIVYDTIVVARKDRPRLDVVLDTQADALKFRDGVLGNFHEVDQNRVREQFETICSQRGYHRVNVNRLLVIFTGFEEVARIEANQSVPQDEIDRLQLRLNNKDLWRIRRCFDSVTFFFYTDAQVKQYEAAGLRDSYAAEYARVVRPHDEFGYLQSHGVLVRFDSKENFDTNYQGNWFYYDR